MKFILLMLLFSVYAGAADKPARTVATKTLELPDYKSYSLFNSNYRPEYRMYFTANDEIMLRFFQRNTPPVSTDKSTPETSVMSFVVLLLSKEDGKLINKKVWPIAGDPSWEQRQKYAIYPLPDGGYTALLDGHLQVLDTSFNIIHERLLDRLPQRYRYSISVPLHGKYFILSSGVEYEIIDYNTFKTVKRLNTSIPINDIWEDKLLLRFTETAESVSYWSTEDDNIKYLFEKTIGGSLSNYYFKNTRLRGGKYLYNGSIMILSSPEFSSEVLSSIKRFMTQRQDYWFTMENGNTSNPVFITYIFTPGEGIGGIEPARRSPIVVIGASKLRGWDLGYAAWLEVYDIKNQRKLLQTKTYNDAIDYVLSADGRTLVVFTEKKGKLEFYNVPPPRSKKK